MSFNGSGTFVINSTGQPVVTGTVISSSTFNSLTADLGTGLSTAITKDGQTTTTAKIPFAQGLSAAVASNFAAGTVGAPSIYLSTDTTTGLYRIGANNDGFAISGVKLLDLGSALVGITGALTVSTTLNVTGVATLGNGAVLGIPASGTVTNLTGTASININGTVGATTPTTGAFTAGTFSTTLGVTGAATLSSTLAVGAVTATSAATHTFNSAVASFAMNLNNTSGSSPNGLSVYYSSGVNGTGNPFLFCSDGASVERATIRSNGGLANFSANNVNLSDASVKSRKEPMGTQWDAWKKIEWMKFKYDDQTHDDWNYGYTAQNIESIYPELVDAWQPDKKDSTLKAVYSEDLKNITGSVLQEAQLRIEQLEARLAALEAK